MADQMEQTSGAAAAAPAYGHHWKEAERVEAYVQPSDEQAAETALACGLIVQMAPFPQEAPIRILDLGSGHGVIAEALLDAYPNAHAVGLDMSEPMMEVGRQRMARFGDRFRYHVGDFGSGSLPADLDGEFDLVVSGRAIHHVPPEGKRRLFRKIYSRLREGGCFYNYDNMHPRDAYLRQRYRDALPDSWMRRMREPANQPARREGGGTEYPDPVGEQLAWLQEAGFQSVDCVWKRFGRCLAGGYKSPPSDVT
jgi:tRNA (cmo5U34)-methyltransferase